MGESQSHQSKLSYRLIYERGLTWIDSLVIMKTLPNGLTLTRYGFSIAKRVGKAVQRNRLKRLLREIIRSQSLKPGWDVVFIVRPQAANAKYHQLEEVIVRLLTRAQLLEK
jgi:ribonuclease P protein component